MKKFLSLVLALVMTMSLVTVSAGAKDFTDSSKINYSEAVDVMSAVKVIDGYAEGDFRPTATLTRGAAAKIICNLILGPTTASALVADAAPYKDVPTNHTFAGYIAYCQKTGIISGYADGTFKPANSLTGYAFMKMLLGALGYKADQEGYTGANWSINVAKRALNIGLADDLVGDFNGVKAVNREEACLYAFNTLKATMVEYDKNSTVIVGNITIKEQSDAKEMANTGKTDGNIDKDGKNAGYDIVFAERLAKDLGVKELYVHAIMDGRDVPPKSGAGYLEEREAGLAELTDWLCQTDVPVYLTIDLDCLDPSAFPGTGTPEAGGVSFMQLLQAILTVTKSNIVGADVNELAPMLDQSGVSTATACKVLRELLLALEK